MMGAVSRSVLWGAVALVAAAPPASSQVLAQVVPCKLTLSLDPGQTVSEQVMVRNHGTAPAVVRVRWLDWTLSMDGDMVFAAPGTTAATLDGAVAFEPTEFSLGPGEQMPLRLRVRMPAEGPPTRWGVMLSEVRPTVWRPEGFGPRVAAELGTTVYATRVKDDTPQGVVEAFEVAPEADTLLALTLRIANPGARHLYVGGEASLADSTGKIVAQGQFGSGVVLPAGERRFRVRVPAPLAPGSYLASVRLDTGQPELLVAERRFTWLGKAVPQIARWSR